MAPPTVWRYPQFDYAKADGSGDQTDDEVESKEMNSYTRADLSSV
jgi:hypothetical protein